ncbi:MAG: tRNA threonylcarbamoyladenosine dehydratase [Lautropia sp.]|nr:tRNA threonylcarbamoyladenosine dehydratase [Lautropia sp.]
MTDQPDRRFASTGRLLGSPGLKRLRHAQVVVVGLGGVGSWAAEALARSGVGNLTLIDLDQIVESNINRQVHALESTLGAAKVDVMARRIQQIAPLAGITAIESFVEPDNIASLIPKHVTVVIDAIDAVRAKAALVSWCVDHELPVIVCGAAGGRRDPLRLQCEDLARTSGDSLLSSLRLRLRRDYGFAPAAGASGHALARARKFGVPAIFSSERASGPTPGSETDSGRTGGSPLACAGYGSIVTVTASMGMAAAARAIDVILAVP